MKLLHRLFPQSLRGQIVAIIVLALVLILAIGSAIEKIAKSDYIAVPNMDVVAERGATVAALLRKEPPQARQAILAAAGHAGLDFRILSKGWVDGISTPLQERTNIGRLVHALFPPDRPPPFGGRWLMVDNRPALVFDLDQQTALVYFGVPDTVLTAQFVTPASYYLLVFVILPTLFSLFAVWAVANPLKRISAALGSAEIDNNQLLFAERGSIEMVGLARALNMMRARIRAMIDNRTRMLRSVSHDLRTPLTRLRLRTERMDEGALQNSMLSDIGQIEALVNETLAYLRNDVSTEEFQHADIASVLQTVCSEFSDVGFSVSYDGPNRLPGWCKPNALARAIGNLCDNGVKFAPHVTVSLAASEATISIEVRDDGPGIPEVARERVFEPFFKMDAARGVSSKHGFGLGLSIVADIIYGQFGKIELIDNQPTGLIVRVDLPRMPVAA